MKQSTLAKPDLETRLMPPIPDERTLGIDKQFFSKYYGTHYMPPDLYPIEYRSLYNSFLLHHLPFNWHHSRNCVESSS
jgi:hypothetical protein